MAKTKLAFKVPEAAVELEPMTRERAVVGEEYKLTFMQGGLLHSCLIMFIDDRGRVLAAGMDVRGMIAPIGTKWVEAFRWQRN